MDVTVYEQASELVELGAGGVVAPNMVRLMCKLGVANELAACAVRLEAAWSFDASAASTKRWAMYDRDPLAQWTCGRITVLGDATHPMLPWRPTWATDR